MMLMRTNVVNIRVAKSVKSDEVQTRTLAV